MLKQKKLLVLACGKLQVPVIKTAKAMGLCVVGADGDKNAPGLALCDLPRVIDISNSSHCLELARTEKVDGVIQICSEVSMPAVGLINESLGLYGPSFQTVMRATNKALMRKVFEQNNVSSPRYGGAETLQEAYAIRRSIGYPFIVKPSRNSGSRGITRLMEDQNEAAFETAFHFAMSESRDKSVVIEQYVEGPEFSVEILIAGSEPHVLTVTDKITTGSPHFVELGHSQPSRFSPTDQEKVIQCAVAGCKALGLSWCTAHAEVKLANGVPYIMEIGARLGGDFITTELTPRSTGINMVEGAIHLTLGEKPDLNPKSEKSGVAIRYLKAEPGVVKAITGVEEARSIPGIEIVDVYVKQGDSVKEITSSLDRIGHVIARGKDATEAIMLAESTCDRIKIDTTKLQKTQRLTKVRVS